MADGESFSVAGQAPAAAQPYSPWHSPVPYLFGGLAATMGLIAFSLLILACSYFNFSGDLEGNIERDLEGGGGTGWRSEKAPPVYEEKILVIMAGQQKPTFIATATASGKSSSSFNSSAGCCSCACEKEEKGMESPELDERRSWDHGQFTQVQVDNRRRATTETSESNQTP